MNGEKAKEVSFERETLLDARKFNIELEELYEQVIPIFGDSEEKNMGMKQVRLYLLTGEKNDRFSEEIYAKIDELQKLRQEAIQSQKQYLNRQSQKSGIKLPNDVMSGKSLATGFGPKVLEKFPHLKIYNYFMWFSQKELDLEKEAIKNAICDGDSFVRTENEPEI